MNKIKQDASQDMLVLNKVFDMLDYVSARVILIEKTSVGERYSVSRGKDIAYVYMTNTYATINVYCDGNMILRRIVPATDGKDVKDALDSLRGRLVSKSKICASITKTEALSLQNNKQY